MQLGINSNKDEVIFCYNKGDEIRSLLDPDLPTNHWSALDQAGMQAAAITVTIILGMIRSASN